jgi:HAD superfamily hydrolase (TIGR01509 family)
LDKKFDFLKDFDTRIFSYEVGATKPDEKIFKALIEKTGVRAEEIVFSDDDGKKLEGARKQGITTFVFKGVEDFKQGLKDLKVTIE